MNVVTSIAFARRLLSRLPSCVPRTSYSRTLSQAKNLVDEANASSSLLSYKDCVLEPAGVPQDEFKKRFQACRSVDEVLHLVFSGEEAKPPKPQDLVASAEALARIQYRILSSFQWAYRDSRITIRVQSSLNSDTVDMFTVLHHHQSFVDLLSEIDRNMENFTPEEAVNLLDTLLRLCVSKNHDVLVKLQQRCIAECQALDLAALARLSEASNFLKRNGFVVSGLVCSLVQEIFDSVTFSADSYRKIATVLCHTGYFFTEEYLDFLLEKSAAMLSSFRGDISPSDSLLFLETGVRFSSGEPRRLQPFLDHCLQSSAQLSVTEMSKLLRLCRLGRLEAPSLFEKARELAMLRRSEGLLRTTEVVGLISIFDDVGWSDHLREEFGGLLAIHMSDVDVLLLKHLASSKFLRECRSRDLMNLFAKRWVEKLPDVFGSVSVLDALIQLYNKTSMIPKYAREELERRLVEELKHGQLALSPERALSCCSFLFKFGNYKSMKCALDIMDNVKMQLSPLQFFLLFRRQKFNDDFSSEHDLPYTWYDCILQRRHEIPNLHIASCLMATFFPSDGRQQWRFLRDDAEVWADIFEESTPVSNHSTFRQALKCILGHQLYVPATLEVLCESALRKSLKVQLAMKLMEACAKVNYKPQCSEELGSLYATHLVEMAERDELPVIDVLQFSHSLLHLDCFTEKLVRMIFSVGFLQKLDIFTEDSPELKESADRMLFECNRCVVLQCPELDLPWMWSAPPSSLAESNSGGQQRSEFFSTVEDVLNDLAGGEGLVRARTQSPYFHHIDFECYAGKEFGFISQHDFRANPCLPVRRLAIILLGEEDYCSNEDHLLGPIAAELRQLEILGYTVVKGIDFGLVGFRSLHESVFDMKAWIKAVRQFDRSRPWELASLSILYRNHIVTAAYEVPYSEFSSAGMDFEAQREYLQKKIFLT